MIAHWRSRSADALVLLLVVAACDLDLTGPSRPHVNVAVAAGGFHVCRVTESGAAYCWGNNQGGQLGDGSLRERGEPSRVAAGATLVSLTAGFAHTCAFDREGRLYCWGSNGQGRLGAAETSIYTFPVEIAAEHGFVAVAPGGLHTCALTAAGEPYCWGSNTAGQVGQRTLPPNCGAGTCTARPVPVSGELRLAQIVAGFAHSCGLTADGVAYCWGGNGAGQLGRGDQTDIAAPVLVTGAIVFRQLSAGAAHTCGVDVGGTVYCWGLNASGQLGAATPPGPECCALHPVRVAALEPMAAVSAGGDHTCALTVRGRAYCWGRNREGQLGNGASFDRRDPQLVAGGLTFRTISAGGAVTCGVTTDGVTYCWGDNFRGQLGNGKRGIRSTVPIAVPVPGTP